MTRILFVFAMALAAPALAAPKKATPRKLVIIDPELAVTGEKTQGFIDAFVARLETVAGWKPGSLSGKGFLSVEAAAEYLKTQRPAFALLASHAFVVLRQKQKLLVLGHAGVWDPKKLAYRGLALVNSNVGALPHQQPGMRLATDIKDMQWLNVLFDGLLKPETHFQFVPAKNENEAVAAVREKRADMALVWGEHLDRYKDDLRSEGGKLRVAFNSAPLPPLALVAMTKNTTVADTKTLAKAVAEVCKGKPNIDTCANLGFLSLVPGPEELHPHLAYKYDNYK
ncbi:MAG: hypothetical protein SF187_15240 [Deltaproteobacteria bacterium]|nr:hypothetical protein [Deltaproteobacteria bacterium]